ncbi:MAG: helix-turn-helix transcriptional regulator [Chloroflexota bacterium]
MAKQLRNKFIILLAYKEQQEGRRIPNKEIAEAVGVNEHTVARWVKNDVNMINVQVLEAFCNYFGCDVGDLLYMERE